MDTLYGRRPVYESLRAARRQATRLLLAEGVKQTRTVADILQQASDLGLPIERAPRQALDDRTAGGNHQGVVLLTQPYPYVELDDVFEITSQQDAPPFILLLDLLQDVQNVGTLMRTADAVGVHGVVVQERRGAGVTPGVVRASSGAVEHLAVARVTNLVRAMEILKESDVWLAGLDMDPAAQRYDQANLSGGLGLVVGGEGEGLRRLVRETCDFLIRLPMEGQVASLNAATAGSVALYAAWQARGFA